MYLSLTHLRVRRQSVHWAAGQKATLEGTQLDYAVKGGLVGTDFKYSLYGKAPKPASKSARRLQSLVPGTVAGSVGGVAAETLDDFKVSPLS